MRVAFVGKGGAGKSMVAGTFVRALAARGRPVLAIDSDPLPGLAFSIGVTGDEVGIPQEAVEEKAEGEDGPRYRLREGLSPMGAVEQYAAKGPDGIRFLQFTKLRGHADGAAVRSQFAFRHILDALDGSQEFDLVGDLPGGTRQPFFGWGRYARIVLVVVEPTAKSLLSARRLARLKDSQYAPRVFAIANKTRRDDDAELIAARSGLQVVAVVPEDEGVAEAERFGRSPFDDAPDSAAVAAVQSLVDWAQAEEDNG